MKFEFFLEQLKEKNIGEMCFYFRYDLEEKERYIGCLKGSNKPYWAGLCDIKDGCSFKDVEQLVNAKIYNEKSIYERWNEVEIITIDGISIEEWILNFEL